MNTDSKDPAGTAPNRDDRAMKMFIGGEWVGANSQLEVQNPYDGSVLATVPRAEVDHVAAAIATAVHGAEAMARLPAFERYGILMGAAGRIESRAEEFARTITEEEGKSIHEARGEVSRAVETLRLSAEEAKRLYGETLPLDADPGAVGKVGFTLRVPVGVVVAISPFNFPLNLVCHKVGPALAGGNAVIMKPAEETPLSALKLTEVLLEAGLPPEAIQCLTGYGHEIGPPLVSDPRVRKVTFTGSRAVGEEICRTAGLKRVTMELGSNSPLIVMPDADIEEVVAAAVTCGYANAGQVCISAQRVLVGRDLYVDFIDALKAAVGEIAVGDPLDEATVMGPMIRTADAQRVSEWIREAIEGGAQLVVGGEVEGRLHAPTVLADVDPAMRVSRSELFGPAVAVSAFADLEDAIRMANDTEYGLSAAIFTKDVKTAMAFARRAEAGNIMINWGPQWRADLMPYGGLKNSGLGKEGPRYAIKDMTESKTVVFH